MNTARVTGTAYIGIILCGLFAELAVRGTLIVPGDAAATATNIADAPGLFSMGVGADALMVVLDVIVAIGLYRLLRGLNRTLALVAMVFRLIQGAVIAGNTLVVTGALDVARGAASDPALAPRTLEIMATHALVYDVALIAFGIACLALGRLLRRAHAAPRFIAMGLSVTGAVYLVGSFAALFAPSLSPAIEPLYGIAIVVEPAVAVWLILVGGHRALSPPAIALVAVLVSACGAADGEPGAPACGADCATGYSARGERGVGYALAEHDGLSLRAWYPTADGTPDRIEYQVVLQLPGFPTEPMPFVGRSRAGAAVDQSGGPHPLVVLSHGFALNPEWYAPLAEHLASHGFFVLAPQHVESDWSADVVGATATRPGQIGATLDFAEQGPYAPFTDGDRVAVVGHSYGGYTALAAAGARIDYRALRARCAASEDPFVAHFICPPFLAGEDALAGHLGLDPVPDGLWPAMSDARIRAVVTLAGDAYAFGPEGLLSVTVPIMALGGTADTGTPWDLGAALTYDHAGSDEKLLVGLEGGEHFLPVAVCEDMPWTQGLPEEFRGYLCDDPAWSRPDAHARIHHLVTAFLMARLADDPVAEATLDPVHYAPEGGTLRYQRQRP